MYLRRSAYLPITLALALTASVGALPASAQPSQPSAADKETARKLLDDGDAAMAKKDYAAALKFYQGADGIMHLPVTGLAVAQAQQAQGQYIEARETALAVTRLPKATPEAPELAEARRNADQMATKLDGMIPSVQVQPSGLPADAAPEVSIDGTVIQSAAALLPRRVNPGAHHIEVKASGFATGVADIKAPEGLQTISVPIAMKAGSETSGPGPGPDQSKDKDKGEPKQPPGGGHKLSILLPVGGGIAAVGLGVGIGTGVAALNGNKKGGSCPTKSCALGIVSDVGFVVAVGGAAVGVAGLVLTLTSHDTPAANQTPGQPSVTLAPVIGPTYAGLRGTF